MEALNQSVYVENLSRVPFVVRVSSIVIPNRQTNGWDICDHLNIPLI